MVSQALVFASPIISHWPGIGLSVVGFRPRRLLEFLQSIDQCFHGGAAGDIAAEKPAATLHIQWAPYEKISSHLKRAIIAAEDSKFLEHEGFDFEAIQKAYEKNLKKGRLVAGGSTISQQLAKNLFLSGQKTPWRKIQEALITLMLENVMSKRRIMEIYLNVIEWGNGVFGAEAAIRHYYGASASSSVQNRPLASRQ